MLLITRESGIIIDLHLDTNPMPDRTINISNERQRVMMFVMAQEWQAGSAPGRSRDQQASDVALCPNCTERCGQKTDYKHHRKSVTVQEFTMHQSRDRE